MRKTIFWLILLIAAVLYSLLVYSWWMEGNANQRQWEVDREMEDVRMMRNAQGL